MNGAIFINRFTLIKNEKTFRDRGFGLLLFMTGIVVLLFFILNHMVHNSFKDCYKFYLKKYIKRLPDGIPTFLATYFLSLLILYICIGLFTWLFTYSFDFEDFLKPRDYFRRLLEFR